MDFFVLAVPDLPPRLRQRLAKDLLDHVHAFAVEVQDGTPADILDRRG